MATLEELERQVEALRTRLAAVEAAQEIQHLKARYGALVDSRYTRKDGPKPADEIGRIADEIVALFAPDAVWDGGRHLGRWIGRDEIRKRFLDPTLQFTIHYFVQPRIQVDGDTAKARWEILSPIRFADGSTGWMSGSEDDEYARLDGRWLHTSMKLTTNFISPW